MLTFCFYYTEANREKDNLAAFISLPANEFSIDIKKSPTFKNAELEALYTINCTNIKNKDTRQFQIIKTNKRLKNYFLADYIIIETTNSNSQYYPIGWESSLIKEADIKSDCISILKGAIKPVNEKEL